MPNAQRFADDGSPLITHRLYLNVYDEGVGNVFTVKIYEVEELKHLTPAAERGCDAFDGCVVLFYGRKAGDLTVPGIVVPDDLQEVTVAKPSHGPHFDLKGCVKKLRECNDTVECQRLLRAIHASFGTPRQMT